MAEIKTCENCGRPIDIPAFALNKRFCCDRCRHDWHNERTRKAKELLAAQAKAEHGDEL